jgi:HCOMODA/2-hydroxy-3-carboxy-muconic semialdehyde decarboxylase
LTSLEAEPLQRRIRMAARALARAGLVHAYGHCSARCDATAFLVCAAKPMGLIGVDEPGTVVPVDGPLPAGALGEVRIHQAVYRRRSDVESICRVQPPWLTALSACGLTPRARHGFSAYFAPSPPVWNDPGLVRSDEAADGVAHTLGDARAVVLRGNGAVTVGTAIEEAAVLAWYLEDSARVEFVVRSTGGAEGAPELTAEEAQRRAVWEGGIVERMWAYLTAGDPEA